MSDHGSIVHVHRPGSGDNAVSSPTSTAPSNYEERSRKVEFMRNLMQNVEEQFRPKRPESGGHNSHCGGGRVQYVGRRPDRRARLAERTTLHLFSLSDIPSLLSENISCCIGDIGNNIGEYYDESSPNHPSPSRRHHRHQQQQQQQSKQPPNEK